MDKTKMDFTTMPVKTLAFGDQAIKVKPFLNTAEQIALMKSYTNLYFFPPSDDLTKGISSYNLLGAELTLALNVLDLCTNIQVFGENGLVEGISEAVYNGVWQDVRGSIENYEEFRVSLAKIVDDIKFQMSLDKSVGTMLDNLSVNLTRMFNKVLSMDLSPEYIDKLQGAVKEIVGQMETSPMGRVFDEAAESGNG